MAFSASWRLLLKMIYLAAVLIWKSTAMSLIDWGSGEQMSFAAVNLESREVCRANLLGSTISFVKSHGFKIVQSSQQHGCLPAMVAIINVCVLWILVGSALGWGAIYLVEFCARTGRSVETGDEESGDALDSLTNR